MQRFVLCLLPLSFAAIVSNAHAASAHCHDEHRVIEIDPSHAPQYGTFQYDGTLELKPNEVVLTFDDGPDADYTPDVLDILDRYCLKATFFAVGLRAQLNPELTKDILRRGHTLGAHTWSHPNNLRRLSFHNAKLEIDRGFAAVDDASGGMVAPFFRYPGLLDSDALNTFLTQRRYATISADINTDDWKKNITAETIIERTITRLDQRGNGILLFHDNRKATVEALPRILDELKSRGYTVAHLAPKTPFVIARADEPLPPLPEPDKSIAMAATYKSASLADTPIATANHQTSTGQGLQKERPRAAAIKRLTPRKVKNDLSSSRPAAAALNPKKSKASAGRRQSNVIRYVEIKARDHPPRYGLLR